MKLVIFLDKISRFLSFTFFCGLKNLKVILFDNEKTGLNTDKQRERQLFK